MAQVSVFHNIVRRETSFTQLLCNMLKHDGVFRDAFLRKCGVADPSAINKSHITAETRLENGHGQADICLISANMRMIIEIKTELRRGKQPSQELVVGKKTYLRWLRKGLPTNTLARLLFLVPQEWIYLQAVNDRISEYKKRLGSRGVEVALLTWPQLLPMLKGNPLLEQFRFLIQERFGPIGFAEEERNLMFSGEFPITEVVKLVKLLDDLRRKFKVKKLDIRNEELGFYLERKGDKSCWLYVGFGPDVSLDKSQVMYFGVGPTVSQTARNAFVTALKKNYSQKAIRPDAEWLLGYIPKNDFDEIDAVAQIEPKLRAIWNAMQES